ncbi:methionyl-tRNA formyltransferase, partial [Phycicoccus flavus]|uniref:methionyl-tRNA formyltransferase n=1 Tax=Phycicoccus flavus TaxID=2502783 RepID=UPI000FF7EEAB
MRLVLAGTPDTAVPSLRALLASRHEVLAVVTRPDARAGRGRTLHPSPVKEVALEHGLEVLTPQRPRDEDFLRRLRDLAPDCCPVVAYGALLPRVALDVPAHGWVNLHFSLLPAWRGAAPVQRAVMAGDAVTGASTFVIEEGLDTGPVLGTVTEDVRPDDTAGTLLDRLAEVGAGLLVATMDGLEDGSLR